MQIVIDIPDEEYKRLIYIDIFKLRGYIENGAPLPKGHGRLTEINIIQSMARKKAEDCFPEGRYYYGYRRALFDFVKDIEDAPTIIKADNGE